MHKFVAVRLAVLLVAVAAAGAFLFFVKPTGPPTSTQPNISTEGSSDGMIFACAAAADCAPNKCCHPDGAVAKAAAPNCTSIACTQECRSGTLDCGCGRIDCVAGRCQAVFTGNYSWC